MTDADPLRTRLAALRQDALGQPAAGDRLDSRLLRLVADAGAALVVTELSASPALRLAGELLAAALRQL